MGLKAVVKHSPLGHFLPQNCIQKFRENTLIDQFFWGRFLRCFHDVLSSGKKVFSKKPIFIGWFFPQPSLKFFLVLLVIKN
jgi:hypothetical protein